MNILHAQINDFPFLLCLHVINLLKTVLVAMHKYECPRRKIVG